MWRHLAAADVAFPQVASTSSTIHFDPSIKMCLFVLTMYDVISKTEYIVTLPQLLAVLTFTLHKSGIIMTHKCAILEGQLIL